MATTVMPETEFGTQDVCSRDVRVRRSSKQLGWVFLGRCEAEEESVSRDCGVVRLKDNGSVLYVHCHGNPAVSNVEAVSRACWEEDDRRLRFETDVTQAKRTKWRPYVTGADFYSVDEPSVGVRYVFQTKSGADWMKLRRKMTARKLTASLKSMASKQLVPTKGSVAGRSVNLGKFVDDVLSGRDYRGKWDVKAL